MAIKVDEFLANLNWQYFLSDYWFAQTAIFYILYLVYTANNYYYTLFYFLVSFFYVGFFLCFYQLDFFVGFLWLTECLVVFVFLLLLFYLGNPGNFNKFKDHLTKFFVLGGVLGTITLASNFLIFTESGWTLPIEFSIIELWDDFYEALHNYVMNDAVGLMISYYLVNSLEFILIGLILLVGSLIVVNLHYINKKLKFPLFNTFFEVLGFMRHWITGFFMRKQNLTDQQFTRASTRSFAKK